MAFIEHGLQSVLNEYNTVWLQNRLSSLSGASSTVSVVVSAATVVLASLSPALESLGSADVTADAVAVWIAGAVDRHTAASSEIHVPSICIVNGSSLSLSGLLCYASLK